MKFIFTAINWKFKGARRGKSHKDTYASARSFILSIVFKFVCSIPDIRSNIALMQSIVLENEHTVPLKACNLNAFEAICSK